MSEGVERRRVWPRGKREERRRSFFFEEVRGKGACGGRDDGGQSGWEGGGIGEPALTNRD